MVAHFDIAILIAFQKDGRLSTSEMADSIGLFRPPCG